MPCPSGFVESASTFGCCECAQGSFAEQGNCVDTCSDGFLADLNDMVCQHACTDSAGSAVNNKGSSCPDHLDKCGFEYDDDDFTASLMCCTCRGGLNQCGAF